ncbi:DUF4148 domain-containing protein [Paraburkholderia fungorum]|uniref:DUF4148 domain-containing protein n=1 Tax=Paraburkholderia fungorum TaxID=134537 RepID=UPI001C1F0A90|nr:DUF4148 domain-containing protein [Paraburkholderia fungorum]MBU7438315.1 DUF4148 domain-containing protein [Paraburkholderia fungorum]
MISEPSKIVLTSLIVGTLGIAAYISQSDKNWLPADDLGLEHGNTLARDAGGGTNSGSVSSGPVLTSGGSAAAIAGNLDAARHSLQRNDLAAAQAQLDAVRPAHRGDDQVRALQREVAARMEQAQQAQAAVQVRQPTRQGIKPAHAASLSSSNTVRSSEGHVATREQPKRVPASYAKTRRVPETAVTTAGAGSVLSGAASPVDAPATGRALPSVPAGVAEVSNVADAPGDSKPTVPASTAQSVPRAELTAQAASAQSAQSAQSAPQLAPAAGTSANSEGGVITRAQVRAEIARARADGALPAFGNPDPAGPGGAPSLTLAPRP